MDFRTFTPQYKTLYGVYGDDFLTFGEYAKSAGNPLENEEVLLKIVDEGDKHTVADKVTFKFENNQLTYRRDVNDQVHDPEVEHSLKDG